MIGIGANREVDSSIERNQMDPGIIRVYSYYPPPERLRPSHIAWMMAGIGIALLVLFATHRL